MILISNNAPTFNYLLFKLGNIPILLVLGKFPAVSKIKHAKSEYSLQIAGLENVKNLFLRSNFRFVGLNGNNFKIIGGIDIADC